MMIRVLFSGLVTKTYIRKEKRDNMGGMRETYQQSNNKKKKKHNKWETESQGWAERAGILSIPCLGKP